MFVPCGERYEVRRASPKLLRLDEASSMADEQIKPIFFASQFFYPFWPQLNDHAIGQLSNHFHQPDAHSAPSWSYSYFAVFTFVSLSVRLSVQGLGRPGNELMAAAGTYGCFELYVVGLFASSLQKEAQ